MKSINVLKQPLHLIILGMFLPIFLQAQDRLIHENEPFDENYADSLLWERINDLRAKNKKNKLKHSFTVRKYISHKNAKKLKEKNSCFHPDWRLQDVENSAAAKKMYREYGETYGFNTAPPSSLACHFMYTEVAAASWGEYYKTYQDLAKSFAEMWWESKGHFEILYRDNYLSGNRNYYMIGVSIKKSGDSNYYGIANVIGFYNVPEEKQ